MSLAAASGRNAAHRKLIVVTAQIEATHDRKKRSRTESVVEPFVKRA